MFPLFLTVCSLVYRFLVKLGDLNSTNTGTYPFKWLFWFITIPFFFFFFTFIPLFNILGITQIAEIWECGVVAENKSACQERQKVRQVENKAPQSAKLTCKRKQRLTVKWSPKQYVLNIYQCWRSMWDSCIKMSETTFLTFFVELSIHVMFKPWVMHKFTVTKNTSRTLAVCWSAPRECVCVCGFWQGSC